MITKKSFFAELIMKRRSVRRYEERAVEREKILACVDAARVAPSACNSQPWHFIIVEDPKTREAIGSVSENKFTKMNLFVKSAPVIVAVVTEPSNFSASFGALLKHKPYNIMDMSMAVEHFCLQAADLDLGTCILGWFHERKVKKILGVPWRKRVHLLITLGYPSDGNRERKKNRRTLDTMMSFERY
jgi:nitroreductase